MPYARATPRDKIHQKVSSSILEECDAGGLCRRPIGALGPRTWIALKVQNGRADKVSEEPGSEARQFQGCSEDAYTKVMEETETRQDYEKLTR